VHDLVVAGQLVGEPPDESHVFLYRDQ
jgi:hypothetical protein